ncbi:MAG: hypothetical protein PHX30_03870 [Candidatus Pacebacteria bacterium]|nr:hypothetical protein [Candidatus Paceibacterota bacterium]
MDIEAIRYWANQNSGFVEIVGIIITIILAFIGWTTGFLKWIFEKPKNNGDKRKAGILLEGKHAQLNRVIGKGPDAGLIDKGEDSNIANSEFESLGDRNNT